MKRKRLALLLAAALTVTSVDGTVTGFLLMGIMNDSNLAAAPVFWCLLGTGIAMETFHGRAL